MHSIEQRLLQNIEAEIPRKVAALRFNEELSMLTYEDDGDLRVAGFHRHINPDATTIFVERALEQRAPEYRDLQHNAKGVGVMLGNTQEVTASPGNRSRTCGLWLTQSLDPTWIQDRRSARPSSKLTMAAGIARHAGRTVQARAVGVERTVASIERPYEQSSLVLINPAPTWLLRQHNEKTPKPTWALARGGMLTRIGVVTLTD